MTEKTYKTETFDKQHQHFGGVINISDFDTDHRKNNVNSGSYIAHRIIADLNWEKKLKDLSHLKWNHQTP